MTAPAPLKDCLLGLRNIAATAPASERRWQTAALQRVYSELTSLAECVFRQHRLQEHTRDEAVNCVAMRIVNSGPLGERNHRIQADPTARAYLRSALEREANTAHRTVKLSRERTVSLDAPLVGSGGNDGTRSRHESLSDQRDAFADLIEAEEQLERNERIEQLKRDLELARARLDSYATELADDMNRGRKATGDALLATLDEMAKAASGQLDINAMVRGQLGEPDDAIEFKKARNKVDARFKRARKSLWIRVEARSVQDALDHDEIMLLEHVFGERTRLGG